MEHFFVINPIAGRADHQEALRREIERIMACRPERWEIFVTRGAVSYTHLHRSQSG